MGTQRTKVEGNIQPKNMVAQKMSAIKSEKILFGGETVLVCQWAMHFEIDPILDVLAVWDWTVAVL